MSVQWAKQRGAYVIGTTSSEEKAAFLKSIGVNCVINYKQVDLDKTLTEKFPVSDIYCYFLLKIKNYCPF